MTVRISPGRVTESRASMPANVSPMSMLRWPAAIGGNTVSDAPFSQVDMLASLASLCGAKVPPGATPDGRDHSKVLLGADKAGREVVVQQAAGLAIRQGAWKYIEPRNGPAKFANTNTESGNAPKGQLFNLGEDPGETDNRIARDPERAKAMAKLLESIRAGVR